MSQDSTEEAKDHALEDKHRLVEVPQAEKNCAMRGGETRDERRVGVTLADDGSCKQMCVCAKNGRVEGAVTHF